MKYVFVIIAIVSLLGAMLIAAIAKSAIHEIEGILLLGSFVGSLGVAAILEAIDKNTAAIKRQRR
jgi:thiamine transporter ThiT